jgi:transposase-like protein
MQYTEEFKRGIVRTLLASGMTRREFAAKTKITLMTLRKWVKQYKDEEIEKVDDNNRKKYSEEYKKRIVTQMLFDGITYKTMAKKTGISPQMLEYWDNKYRYIIIADHEKMINKRRKLKQEQRGTDTEQEQEGTNRRKNEDKRIYKGILREK